MTVAIEARALSVRGGVGTYTYQLVQALAAVGGERLHVLLHRASPVPLPPSVKTHVIPYISSAGFFPWLHWRVPQKLKVIRPDIVHFTKADVPYGAAKARWKTVVTIYDIIPLLFPSGQPLLRRLYWPGALKRAVQLSDHIITISEVSKRDLVRRFGIPDGRVTVTPLAVDTNHFRPTERRLYDFPYILYVGARDPRKNVAALIRAFAVMAHDVPHRLVITGRRVTPDDGAAAEVRRLGLDDRVIWREFIPYPDLPALYAGADVFVWPSIYEGWGFPPQEAMACGTPVIVSDGGALPEVVGSAGQVVPFTEQDLNARRHDGTFDSDLTKAMKRLLEDAEKREAWRAAGLSRVRQFTWEKVARETLRVYASLL